MAIEDRLPRIFQANLARFYDRVIGAALEALHTHYIDALPSDATLDAGLTRAAALVDNYSANEAAKAFALALAAAFERQLARWLPVCRAARGAPLARVPHLRELITLAAGEKSLDLDAVGLRASLAELALVANVVRHGDGGSCDALRASAPHLWGDPENEHRHLLTGVPLPSEGLRLGEADLRRYIGAVTHFWGCLDPLPMAIVEPYRPATTMA